MNAALKELVRTLLWEAYSSYPCTPGAPKHAPPTPFGILYPPEYARGRPGTYEHLQMEVVAQCDGEAALSCSFSFLQAVGRKYVASERVLAPAACKLGALASAELALDFGPENDVGRSSPELCGRLLLSAERLEPRLFRVRVRVENKSPLPRDAARALDRPAALARSLLSTHVVLSLDSGLFVSPLERTGAAGAASKSCINENVWPVLATPADDTVLGAAIILPDHPELGPQSMASLLGTKENRGSFVRRMAGTSQVTPEELLALHDSGLSNEPANASSAS